MTGDGPDRATPLSRPSSRRSLTALLRRYGPAILAGAAALGLSVGTVLWALGLSGWATSMWFIATLPPLLALVAQMVASLRRGDIGLDAVALLSMTAALAFGEPLAANVVALMYSGGQLLEAFAAGRAEREMTALVGRVATTAMRIVDGTVIETPVVELHAGDRLLVRHGEVVPVDGRLASGSALLDLSALTGESVPARLARGDEVLSGSTSVGEAFELLALRPSAESTYARIVALVENARLQKPPVQRLADRYALGFLFLTLALAGAAWFLSGDPVRALSVLVVATPCPLILAVPVAMISGMSRAAGRGVLIKGGAALEGLTKVRSVVFDKTGTLTRGSAQYLGATVLGALPEDEVLAVAAGLDQASGHVLAAAVVMAARSRSLPLPVPTDVVEDAGTGLSGTLHGRRVALGGRSYVARQVGIDPAAVSAPDAMQGAAHVWVAVDGRLAGILHFEDVLRPDAASLLAALRGEGIERIVMASGDRKEAVHRIAAEAGIDEVYGELTPEAKVEVVAGEDRRAPAMMVGDGVNDAPALAAATVGVALGARGEAASSEAADVVVLVDRLEPVVDAVRIARRTRTIALQSVLVGIGLSLVAMVAASFGYLPPVTGAFLQEAIDVAVILNALRALR